MPEQARRPDGEPPRRSGAGANLGRAIVALGLVSLLAELSSRSIDAVLPIFLTTTVGLSMWAFGAVDGLYHAASSLLRTRAARGRDTVGGERLEALVGYEVATLIGGSSPLAGHLTDRSQGLASAAAEQAAPGASDAEWPAASAAATRSLPIHRMLGALGPVGGPLVAYWVLLARPGSYRLVFLAAIVLATLALAILTMVDRRFSSSRGPAAAAGVPAPVEQFRRHTTGVGDQPTIRQWRVAAAVGLLGLFTVSNGFIYLQLAQNERLAIGDFPLLAFGTALCYLVLRLPLGLLAARAGPFRTLLLAHVPLLLAYVFAEGSLTGPSSVLGCLACVGAYQCAIDNSLVAVIERPKAGFVNGPMLRASVPLSRLLSSVGYGLLWAAVGYSAATRIAGAALVVAVLVGGWLLKTESTPHVRSRM